MQRHINRNHPGTGQRPVKYSGPNNMQFKTPLASYYAPYHNPFQQYPSNIKSSTPSPYDGKLEGSKEKEEKNNKMIIYLRNGTQQLTQQERAEQLVELHKILIESMMSKVKQWTNDKPYLLAGKYPYPLETCSAELTVTRVENKWYIRAVIDGVTTLNDEELLDFLHKSKGSTCVYMKIILESAVLQSQHFQHKMGSQSSPHLPSSRLIPLLDGCLSS